MYLLASRVGYFIGILMFANFIGAQVTPLVFPSDNETVFYQDIQLGWPISTATTRLQLSYDESFSQLVLDTIIDGHIHSLRSQAANKNYYWRYQHDKLNWSKIQSFYTSHIKIESSPVENFPIKLITSRLQKDNSIIIDNPDHKLLDVEVYDGEGRLLIRQRTDTSYKGINLTSMSDSSDFEVNILSGSQVLKSKVSFE
jgi:hypothetical protein